MRKWERYQRRCRIAAGNVVLIVRSDGVAPLFILAVEMFAVLAGVIATFLIALLLADSIREAHRFVESSIPYIDLSNGIYWTTVSRVGGYDKLGILAYTATLFVILAISMLILTVLMHSYQNILEYVWQDLPACNEISHGESLAEVMIGLHEANVEYSAAFLLDGTKIGEWTNFSTTSVACGLSSLADGACIISVHNHPDDSSAPSGSDFAAMIFDREWCSIVVTKTRIFVLSASPDCWTLNPDEIEERFHTIRLRFLLQQGLDQISAIRSAATEIAALYGFHLSEKPFQREICKIMAADIIKDGEQVLRTQRWKNLATDCANL